MNKNMYNLIYTPNTRPKVFFFSFLEMGVSLSRDSGCPGIVDQTELKLTGTPASVSRVLGLKACTIPSLQMYTTKKSGKKKSKR